MPRATTGEAWIDARLEADPTTLAFVRVPSRRKKCANQAIANLQEFQHYLLVFDLLYFLFFVYFCNIFIFIRPSNTPHSLSLV